MKRVTSLILVVLLLLLPIGCTVEDETGTSTTTTGTPTTTTTLAANQAKLVTLDFEKYSREYYARDAFALEKGKVYYNMWLGNALNDPANAGCQFRVCVEVGYPTDPDAMEALVEKMRSDGMRVEVSSSGWFYAQGTKEQLASMATWEPNYGYYLWLAPPWRPDGYSEVYSDVMAAWLDEMSAENKVWVRVSPALNDVDLKVIGERYRGENISVRSSPEINANLSCDLTKEEILKMAADPEIRYVDICAPVSWRN